MIVLILSVLLAFVLGFSAHRASICTVAAVAEVMSSGTTRVFLSFLKVILWVTLVNGLLVLWMPELARPESGDPLSLMAVLGGFVFGMGAAINGGCSFSTISKIAQGNFHVALTLPAFVIGVVVSASVLSRMDMDMSMPMPQMTEQWYLAILVVLSIWGLREIVRIAGPNIRGEGVWHGLTAGRYRLSTGAALIGIGSGCLYALHGRWAYSSKIVDTFIERPQLQTAPADVAVWLLASLLLGAVASAISSRQFTYSFAADMWLRNVIGGFVMGFGAMMVPGGNAALILQDLPGLSLRALLAYLAMVLGIAVSLMIVKRLVGASLIVSCSGDFCSMQKTTSSARSGKDEGGSSIDDDGAVRGH